MKCLVTGHKGYIGSHLYNKLNKEGHEVRGIDLKDGNDILENLPIGYEPDYIFHLAAFPRVQHSVKEPFETFRNNALGSSKILEYAHSEGSERVIFSSSSAIYGDSDEPSPNSPYGLHKWITEQEMKLYTQLYDDSPDMVALRYFNVYSEDQPFDGPYTTVIAAWMQRLEEDKKLRIDGDGTQRRDFIHVDDIVGANLFCMNYDDKFNGNAFDIGTGENYSLNYIKNYIEKVDKSAEFYYSDKREGDVEETLANISEIKKIGWKPKINFEDGLKRCFGNG